MSCNNDNDSYNLIFSGGESGAVNMAKDLYILNRYKQLDDFTVCPTLRLYFFSPPSLSLGFFQNKFDGGLITKAKSLGYDIVRRPTGGRAVLHLNEITYSVVASYKNGIFAGKLMETYRIISNFLYNFFLKIGLNPDIHNIHMPSAVNGASSAGNADKNFNCFLKAHSYEVTFSKKKICGNSQRRNDKAFLQHGSIYIDYNPEEHCELFENNYVNAQNEENEIFIPKDKDKDKDKYKNKDKDKLNIYSKNTKECNKFRVKDYAEKITGIKQELFKSNKSNLNLNNLNLKDNQRIAHDVLLDKNKLLNVLQASFEDTYNLKSKVHKFNDAEISEINRLAGTVFIA
jgi:lipoate-protein ligase A